MIRSFTKAKNDKQTIVVKRFSAGGKSFVLDYDNNNDFHYLEGVDEVFDLGKQYIEDRDIKGVTDADLKILEDKVNTELVHGLKDSTHIKLKNGHTLRVMYNPYN